MRTALFVMILAASAASQAADLKQCVGPRGETYYRAEKCAAGEKEAPRVTSLGTPIAPRVPQAPKAPQVQAAPAATSGAQR